MMRARTQGGGHPQGAPLRLDYVGAHKGGGHPQGVPIRLDNGGAHSGEGTHRGCPYGWIMWARTRGGGEGTHEGCPYGWIMGARTRGEGTHKGCPYTIQAASRLLSQIDAKLPWEYAICGSRLICRPWSLRRIWREV